MLFLRKLQQQVLVIQATVLVDNTYCIKTALSPLEPRLQMPCHGNQNAVEYVSREVKLRIFLLSNMFSHVQLTTVERWLQPSPSGGIILKLTRPLCQTARA